jgi:hypothetical protein
MNIERRMHGVEHENVMLDRYRQADELERLFMYLQHREIRDDFMEIELRDSFYRGKARKTDSIPI